MSQDPRLALVHNLMRIYREVLEEPVPGALLALLARLETEAAALQQATVLVEGAMTASRYAGATAPALR
jgi:hypothetical protein